MNAQAADTVAAIALELPEKPTSADILRALIRAEQSGFTRAYRQMAEGIVNAPTLRAVQ